MNRRFLLLCATVFLGLVLPFQSMAQIAGRINGRAVDPSGATIAGVRTTLTESDTRLSRTGTTGADGFYEFADVLPGKYTLQAEATGFQKQVISNIKLEVAQALRQDLNLVLGATSERMDVTANAVALQTEDSQVGGVVETKAIGDLPLNGRDFTQLMILLPGASEGTPAGTTGKHYVERVADGFMAKEVQSPDLKSHRVQRVLVQWDEQRMGLTTSEFERKLLEGEPRIAALRHEPQGMTFVFFLGEPGDEKLVARRLKEVFTAAHRG